MKNTVNYKSRFRILKGGKISLIVSGLLVSCSLISPANANIDPLITVDTALVTEQTVEGDQQSIIITSSGSITGINAVTTLVNLYNGLDASQYFTNNGTLTRTASSGVARGIFTNSWLEGTITNNNIMSISSTDSTAHGMFIDTYMKDGSSITNSGSMTVTGSISSTTDASGIFVSNNMEGDASITNTNTGSIIATADRGDAYGIYTNNMESTTSITNSGTITTTSSSAGTNYDSSTIYVVNMESSSSITNTASGTMNATSSVGDAYGVFVGTTMNGTSSIGNSGTINATSTAASNFGAYGIYVGNLNEDSSISNSGTINATSTNGVAFGIYATNMSGNSSITNSGTITVDSDGSRALGGGTNSSLSSVGIYSQAITSGNEISNEGTITATYNGAADQSAYSLKINGADGAKGTIVNEIGAKLYGNIIAKDSTATGSFTNKGLISLPYNATVNNAARIDNFTQTADGILEIGLFTDGTTTTHSQLSSNSVTFEDGSTINVNVLSSSTNVGLLVGEKLDNIIYGGTIDIQGALNITDNSALLNFELDPALTDGYMDLNIVEAQTIEEAVTESNYEENQKSLSKDGNTIKAARVLDIIKYDASMAPLIGALNSLATNEEVARAVESTTPQTTSATVGATTQISNGIAGIVEQRQNVNIAGGLNSGDEMFASENAWVKTYGSFGKQEDKNGINGFDVSSYGIGMGIDGEYKDNQNIGVAFFYTNASVDVNSVAQKSDLDVFTTLVYGNAPVIDQKTNFLYQLGYAIQNTNSKRTIFTGDTATADYTSKTTSLDLKLMRDYLVNDKLLLQPIVSTTYRHFDSPSYSETGAGAANLTVDGYTSTELLIGAGFISHYEIDDKTSVSGNFHANYDIHDREQTVNSAFAGASSVKFETKGIDNGRWNYEAGLGIDRELAENGSINLSYSYQAEGSGFSNNVISAKYVYKF